MPRHALRRRMTNPYQTTPVHPGLGGWGVIPHEVRGRGRRDPRTAAHKNIHSKEHHYKCDLENEPLECLEILHTDRRENFKNFFLLALFRKKTPSWVFLGFFGFFSSFSSLINQSLNQRPFST